MGPRRFHGRAFLCEPARAGSLGVVCAVLPKRRVVGSRSLTLGGATSASLFVILLLIALILFSPFSASTHSAFVSSISQPLVCKSFLSDNWQLNWFRSRFYFDTRLVKNYSLSSRDGWRGS